MRAFVGHLVLGLLSITKLGDLWRLCIESCFKQAQQYNTVSSGLLLQGVHVPLSKATGGTRSNSKPAPNFTWGTDLTNCWPAITLIQHWTNASMSKNMLLRYFKRTSTEVQGFCSETLTDCARMQQGKLAECLGSPKAARAKDVFCNMKLDGYPRDQIIHYFAARYRPFGLLCLQETWGGMCTFASTALMHSYLLLRLLVCWMSDWKQDCKHSRRYNSKQPFLFRRGQPALDQLPHRLWTGLGATTPSATKQINRYEDATSYSPIDWIPRPSRFHSSWSGGGLGGAVDLRQTQANKATHAQAVSRNLSRKLCAASISAAVSGGRHPSGGACMGHTIKREPLQTGISWRRLDFEWTSLNSESALISTCHREFSCAACADIGLELHRLLRTLPSGSRAASQTNLRCQPYPLRIHGMIVYLPNRFPIKNPTIHVKFIHFFPWMLKWASAAFTRRKKNGHLAAFIAFQQGNLPREQDV